MASRSATANTIDLDSLIKFYNPQTRVLSESAPIQDVSLADDDLVDNTPPFPASRPASLYVCQLSALNRETNVYQDNNRRFTLAAPTPPRLRTMIQETFNIDRWAETLSAHGAPGHTPWENKQIALSHSCQLAPKSARYSAHLRVHGDNTFIQHSASNKTMSTDIAEMMVELQDLNTFFKGGLEDMDNVVAIIGEQKGRLEEQQAKDGLESQPLPQLVVSTSHDAVQVPVGNRRPPDAPLEIASRRGKKSLPPLSVEPNKQKQKAFAIDGQILYPGIPAAFLGTPSGRSASSTSFNLPFEPATSTPIPLNEMVTHLRSKCASIHRHVREKAQTESRLMETMSGNEAETSDGDRDSWAFADNFLLTVKCDVDQVFPLPTRLRPILPLSSPPATSPPPTPVKSEASKSIQPPSAPRKSMPLTQAKTRAPPKSAPRRSIPAPPPLPSTPFARRPTQGILKRSKNVRFVTPETPASVNKGTPNSVASNSKPPPRSCLSAGRASLPPATTTMKDKEKEKSKENGNAPIKPRRYTMSAGGIRGSMRNLTKHYREVNENDVRRSIGGTGARAGGNGGKEKVVSPSPSGRTPLRSIFTRFK